MFIFNFNTFHLYRQYQLSSCIVSNVSTIIAKLAVRLALFLVLLLIFLDLPVDIERPVCEDNTALGIQRGEDAFSPRGLNRPRILKGWLFSRVGTVQGLGFMAGMWALFGVPRT